jgi:hypothetical protein
LHAKYCLPSIGSWRFNHLFVLKWDANRLERFFAYGLNIVNWYDDMVGEDFLDTAKKNWPNYFQYCEKHKIQINPDDKLPKIMLDYNKLQDSEYSD